MKVAVYRIRPAWAIVISTVPGWDAKYMSNVNARTVARWRKVMRDYDNAQKEMDRVIRDREAEA